MWQMKTAPLATVGEKVPNISRGSVATHLRCGGIFNDNFFHKFTAELQSANETICNIVLPNVRNVLKVWRNNAF